MLPEWERSSARGPPVQRYGRSISTTGVLRPMSIVFYTKRESTVRSYRRNTGARIPDTHRSRTSVCREYHAQQQGGAENKTDSEPESLFAANTVSLHRDTLFKALFNRMKGGSVTRHFLFRLGPVASAEIEETTLRRIHPVPSHVRIGQQNGREPIPAVFRSLL